MNLVKVPSFLWSMIDERNLEIWRWRVALSCMCDELLVKDFTKVAGQNDGNTLNQVTYWSFVHFHHTEYMEIMMKPTQLQKELFMNKKIRGNLEVNSDLDTFKDFLKEKSVIFIAFNFKRIYLQTEISLVFLFNKLSLLNLSEKTFKRL